MTELVTIKKEDVCNLSRIPLGIDMNPVYKTACREPINDRELQTFREEFQPRTLSELFGVKISSLDRYSSEHIFLPWIHTKPVDKSGIRDTAFFGMTSSDVDDKVQKISILVKSFREMGYRPDRYWDRRGGRPTGYFLLGPDRSRRFYVVSGNHRVATYFSLEIDAEMTVAYEDMTFMKRRDLINCGFSKDGRHPKEFKLQEAEMWPSVISNFLTTVEARNIAEQFLKA